MNPSHSLTPAISPTAPTLRQRLNEVLVEHALRGLTERDRAICRLLEQHRVLTVHHVADAYFGSYERARHRMTILYERRVIDRFRPYRATGSAPYHYTLDVLGAALCAGERGEEPAQLKPSVVERWSRSSQLQHLLDVNSVFTALMGRARKTDSEELVEWWSDHKCAKAMAGLVYPDGYGVWQSEAGRIEFCIEVDRGTETIGRVADKLRGYEALRSASGVDRWVLFWLHSSRREAELRKAMGGAAVRVATGVADRSPAGDVWLSLGRARRVSLGELGSGSDASFSVDRP